MQRYDSLIEYMNIYKLTKYKMLQVDDKYMTNIRCYIQMLYANILNEYILEMRYRIDIYEMIYMYCK